MLVQSQASRDFDALCLSDLGLKMPRYSKKYVICVAALSSYYGSSPYFCHVRAAQCGRQQLYKDAKDEGFVWTGETWVYSEVNQLLSLVALSMR